MTIRSPEDIEAARRWVRSLVTMRHALGLSQRDVAAAMGNGVSQSDISRFELGADYRASTLIRYARSMGLQLDLTMTFAEDDES